MLAPGSVAMNFSELFIVVMSVDSIGASFAVSNTSGESHSMMVAPGMTTKLVMRKYTEKRPK